MLYKNKKEWTMELIQFWVKILIYSDLMMCNFVNLQCKNHSVEYASMYKFMTWTPDGALAVFTQADLTITYMYTTCS